MNYMKEVAQLLGVELEEEFKVKGFKNNRYKFTSHYLMFDFGSGWTVSHNLDRLVNGLDEIEPHILTTKEKEYLSNVIKPFRNRVFGIVKQAQCINGYEYININIKEENGANFCMGLPIFKVGTMFKGMKLDKAYSLEELGL